MKHLYKPVLVLFLLVTGVACSAWLKVYLNLSDTPFVALVTISSIFSILLPNLNQIQSLSLLKGELILREVKESEAAVKRLATATLELVEASSQGALLTDEFDDVRYSKAVEEVRSLVDKP